MKYKFNGSMHSFLDNALLTAITAAGEGAIDRIWNDRPEGELPDVCLTINGHEVPLEEFFRKLQSSYDIEVAKAAQELIESRFSDSLQKVSEEMDRIQRDMRVRLRADLGLPPLSEDDRW